MTLALPRAETATTTPTAVRLGSLFTQGLLLHVTWTDKMQMALTTTPMVMAAPTTTLETATAATRAAATESRGGQH